MLLEGVFLPLTTPFHPDGRLFLRKLETNVARYSLTPAAGMLVGQIEPDALTDAETKQVLETAVHAAAETKVMIASIGRESLMRTLSLAEVAATSGYDVVSVRAPAFAEESSLIVETMNYFRMVADRSALPVLIDANVLSAAWMAELAAHPNILWRGQRKSGQSALCDRRHQAPGDSHFHIWRGYRCACCSAVPASCPPRA